MLPHPRYLRRVVMIATTAATALAASSAPALAAGQTLCVGGSAAPVVSPDSDGQCPPTYTGTTLASQADLTALQARVDTLERENTTLKSDVSTLNTQVSTLQSDNAKLKFDVSTLNTKVARLQGDYATLRWEADATKTMIYELQSRDVTLATKVSGLETKLSKVSYDAAGVNGKPTLKITGANLQLVSGSGTTGGTVNGLGNLFIGYNEQSDDSQKGSHNLIIGPLHSFTSYGGLIAGSNNTVSGSYASVSGGDANTASGWLSSVSGGARNTASGPNSSVSGGERNTASAFLSSILGGRNITVATDGGTSP